jgi:isopenicillin-N N-acyltransferase-like protein
MQVKLFCEFGMLAKLGVNSAGVGLHFNILHHSSDNDSGGVPVHAIARRLLEQASSVEEAIELARSARVSASTVLTVFSRQDSSPRAVSIELSPERTALVLPREDGWLLHTNHFLDPQLSLGEQVADRADTQCRLGHLEQVIGQMGSADLRARAAAICGAQGDSAPICFHPDMAMPDTERWETLLSVGIDTERCQLEYVAGTPVQLARAGFQTF